MNLRIANASPLRSLLVVAGVAGWLVMFLPGLATGQENYSFVEDGASFLSARDREELDRELDAYSQSTDCWILVKTLPGATDKATMRSIFGAAWSRWGSPECAVVFFFIREKNYSRMMLAPGLESRLSSEEIGAILRGVVVPRFSNGDPEGAVLAGIESLQVALVGELRELPSTFRPRGRDLVIGTILILIAISAFALAAWQLLMVFKETRKSRSSGL